MTLQRTATHCNALQHTGTHRNALQHAATHCNTARRICGARFKASLHFPAQEHGGGVLGGDGRLQLHQNLEFFDHRFEFVWVSVPHAQF